MAKLSGQFDRDGDEDKSVASNFVFGPQSKPSTAKSSESEKVNTYIRTTYAYSSIGLMKQCKLAHITCAHGRCE